jgi:hypothetical protein
MLRLVGNNPIQPAHLEDCGPSNLHQPNEDYKP